MPAAVTDRATATGVSATIHRRTARPSYHDTIEALTEGHLRTTVRDHNAPMGPIG